MNYKIVGDSCCDLPKKMRENKHFSLVPLTLMVDNYTIIDDETFDQADFIKKVAESVNGAKSACPSPERFMSEYGEENTDIYVVTLSSNLSGSYDSAYLGKRLYEEDGGTNRIHIFNSKSASSGEAKIAMKIYELAEAGKSFEEVVETVEKYIDDMRTYFVLETLEPLRKNGRLSKLQAILAGTLNIKPIMSEDGEGNIIKLGQARGVDRALDKMIEHIKEVTKNINEKELFIAHCNCSERALKVKEKILAVMQPKKITIVETAGVSTLYANDGGIVIAV
ncbi:MAG: DegV family protein [Lachnospiraceae bacterium]